MNSLVYDDGDDDGDGDEGSRLYSQEAEARLYAQKARVDSQEARVDSQEARP